MGFKYTWTPVVRVPLASVNGSRKGVFVTYIITTPGWLSGNLKSAQYIVAHSLGDNGVDDLVAYVKKSKGKNINLNEFKAMMKAHPFFIENPEQMEPYLKDFKMFAALVRNAVSQAEEGWVSAAQKEADTDTTITVEKPAPDDAEIKQAQERQKAEIEQYYETFISQGLSEEEARKQAYEAYHDAHKPAHVKFYDRFQKFKESLKEEGVPVESLTDDDLKPYFQEEWLEGHSGEFDTEEEAKEVFEDYWIDAMDYAQELEDRQDDGPEETNSDNEDDDALFSLAPAPSVHSEPASEDMEDGKDINDSESTDEAEEDNDDDKYAIRIKNCDEGVIPVEDRFC